MTSRARPKREYVLMLANDAHAAIRSVESAIAGMQGLSAPYPLPAAVAKNAPRVFVECGLALRGEFTGCDHLAIAGHLESDIALRVLDILEPGSFKGSATVEEARIAGRYEGTLIVAETLVVGPAAYISGSVQCRKLQLEDGGKIDGELRILSDEVGKAAKSENDAAPQALVLEASPGTEVDADAATVESGDVFSASDPIDALLVAAGAAEDDALLAEAEESFRTALKANGFDVAALSGLGHVARQRGDLAQALNYFHMIMAVDAENVSVRYIAIEILHALSRHDEAAALAKEVEALRSQYALMPGHDTDEGTALPGLDEAEAMFKSVLDRHPKNLGALAGLGHLARRRGDGLAMLKYYTAALAIEPANTSLRLELARTLKEQGEIALARQILEVLLAERRAPLAAARAAAGIASEDR